VTKESRREIALRWKHLVIDNHVNMKVARLMLKKEYDYSGTYDSWRRSLYNYCKEFKVPTS